MLLAAKATLLLVALLPQATKGEPSVDHDLTIALHELAGRNLEFESRVYCMALAIYFEGGSTGESADGQRHIARVIHERAKANKAKWGGSDVCDVVFYKRSGVCQFTFACLPVARRTPRDGPAWRFANIVAADELEGASELSERSVRYYMNPVLTSDRNACRFRKEFVPVVEAGRHHFFREPDETERIQLAKAEPEECSRYALKLKMLERARAARERARAARAAQLKRQAARKNDRSRNKRLARMAAAPLKDKYARR